MGEGDGSTLVATAYKLLDGGDNEGAEEAFLAALSIDPSNLDAREGLVWTYIGRGDFERAAEAADARLLLDAEGAWYDEWLTVISLTPSRRDEAMSIYRDAIAANSLAMEPRLRLGELLVWSSRSAEAIEVYRDALQIDSANTDANLGLAAALSYEGERVEANAIFDSIIDEHPHNIEALLGRARSARWEGDFETSRRLFDRALLVSSEDLALLVERVQIEIDPAIQTALTASVNTGPYWRDQAIIRYQQEADADPTALDPRLRLAELLSWVLARRWESVAVYREALEIEPSNTEARLGLAVVLSWQGERDEANDLFDDILDDEPNNVDALLGRARSARWEGDWDTARELFDHALDVGPPDPVLVNERVQFEIDPALQAAQIAVIDALEGPRDGEPERVTEIGIFPTYSSDSESFTRLSIRAMGQVFPWMNTRLRLLAGFTRFKDPTDSLDRITIGAEVRQTLPLDFYVRGLFLGHLYSDAPTGTEWDIEGGLQNPRWPVQFRLGYWQHAIVDELRTYDQIAYLEGVGSGGMSVAAIRSNIQIRDAYLAVSGSPIAGTYLYAMGGYGTISDGNARLVGSAGLGFDTLYYAALEEDHELYVKYDFFILTYAETQPDYWSPDAFLVHTPGLAWMWRVAQQWTVGAEAGAPINPANGSIGYLVGAFGRFLFVDHWYLQARVRVVDDTEYAVFAGTIGVGYMF